MTIDAVVEIDYNRGVEGLRCFLFASRPPVTMRNTRSFDKNGERASWRVFCKGDKMARRRKSTLAVYGKVMIERLWCKGCEMFSFVRNGCYVCCGEPVETEPNKYKRMSEPPQHRLKPPKKYRDAQLEKQGGRCFYCGVRFGSVRMRRGKPVTIRLQWDHRLPYKYSQNNSSENFVAACHVCNAIKNDKMFDDLEKCVTSLTVRREELGYDF